VVARRSGLGRGLSSLIPADTDGEAPGAEDGSVLAELPLNAVVANRHQPRQSFDDEALASLAASIRELGVLQPILVRPADAEGTYELIAGERRWRAARRAGLDAIPAIIRSADEVASLEQAVVENLHRSDLNAMEEAAAYQQLIEEFDLTHEQVAARVGKSRVAVTNALRLFQLPATLQRMVADGQLTGGHAKALLATPDRAFMEHLAKRAVAEGLSVRDVEDAVRERAELEGGAAPGIDGADASAPPKPRAVRSANRDPGLLELEELLAEFLDTRVAIKAGRGRGKLTVEFADLEDLERIYRLIAAGPGGAEPSDADDEVEVLTEDSTST
jgi:ParB family transcriptional regulator, chromosome partitioning protein